MSIVTVNATSCSATRAPSTWDLTGRVVVVTGGVRGSGRATAMLLCERGAELVVTDRADAVSQPESADVTTLVGDVADGTSPGPRWNGLWSSSVASTCW